MAYTILPVTTNDLPDIVAIHEAAFVDDPIFGQIMANVSPEAKLAHDLHWYEREFGISELNGLRWKKLIDGNGELLAFAVWQYPYTLTPEQRARKDQLDRLEELEHPFPEGSNQKLFDAYFAALEKKQMRWMDKSRDYRLDMIGVLPAHQRKGLGALLIAEGVANVDRDNARVYLEASAAGYGLYLRHGWKQVDEVAIDISRYGGRGEVTMKLLLRKPGSN